jgi:hypothetical protein
MSRSRRCIATSGSPGTLIRKVRGAPWARLAQPLTCAEFGMVTRCACAASWAAIREMSKPGCNSSRKSNPLSTAALSSSLTRLPLNSRPATP